MQIVDLQYPKPGIDFLQVAALKIAPILILPKYFNK